MATVHLPATRVETYPDSDGRPMAETPYHRKNMTDLIETLDYHVADDPQVYVSGNMFVYYVPGNRLRHVAPDVFLVRGVPKRPERRCYLVWEEGKGPDVVIEITSKSTREEDVDDKFVIYQKTLRVPEFFLFDPFAEYLDPPLCGYRLRKRRYVRIAEVEGRLPSEVLGLHLERDDWRLRLYDPETNRWLPTPTERAELAEAARRQEAAARKRAEAAADRLQRELEALKRKLSER